MPRGVRFVQLMPVQHLLLPSFLARRKRDGNGVKGRNEPRNITGNSYKAHEEGYMAARVLRKKKIVSGVGF